MNERSVEIPWAMARLHGKVLDVGAAESVYLPRLSLGDVAIDLRPAIVPVPSHVSYRLMDASNMDFEDNTFDTTLCLSTFEHLGRRHEPYGTETQRDLPDRAWVEMIRVTKPGGRILLTIPFGRYEDHGWLVNYDGPLMEQQFFGEFTRKTLDFFQLHGAGYLLCQQSDLADSSYHVEEARAGGIVCVEFVK